MSADRDPLKHYTTLAAEVAWLGDGGPAFPVMELDQVTGQIHVQNMGMTLRDYFAAKAMSTLIETMATVAMGGATHPRKNAIAKFAYEMADAMLLARAGSTP